MIVRDFKCFFNMRYNFDFILFIKVSSFIACIMSPLILSLPCINAAVGFSFPENIAIKLSLSSENVTSGDEGDSPCPASPETRKRKIKVNLQTSTKHTRKMCLTSCSTLTAVQNNYYYECHRTMVSLITPQNSCCPVHVR